MTVKQGIILRQIMSEKDISVSEMSRRLNLSRAAINNYSPDQPVLEDSKTELAQYKRKKAKTVKVKSHTRRSKSGKVSRVKSHRRSKG